jgi:hypothetical protein
MNSEPMIIKDLYTFDEMVYFSVNTNKETLYYKGESYGIELNSFSERNSYGDRFRELKSNIAIQKTLNLVSRSDYYNEIKNKLNEYCNKEVAERIGGIENE